MKSREATEAPQTGGQARDTLKDALRTWPVVDHPVRALFGMGPFLMARPPLLGKEGKTLD